MAGRTRIFLYGDSIVLASIGASLALVPHFDVVRRSPSEPGPTELAALAPDAVLFDFENGHPEAAFELLETDPELLLLGVSPDGNVVRQWSGRQHSRLSTRDLTALIEDASRGGTAASERPIAGQAPDEAERQKKDGGAPEVAPTP